MLYSMHMKPTLSEMLDEVYALSLTGKRDELVQLAGRERINNDLDVVAFYLAGLAIGGSQLAQAALEQFIQLENAELRG